jgi:quercetin dioxygenase-like cupin family protein
LPSRSESCLTRQSILSVGNPFPIISFQLDARVGGMRMSKMITICAERLFAGFAAIAMGFSVMAQEAKPRGEQVIIRKDLLTALVGDKSVGRVEIKQIDFAPDQKTGLHQHPCPVVGYVARGTILLEVEGQPPKLLPEGGAFFEPANTKIMHFDNASPRDPATFIAFYLLGKDDQKLIELLE